MPHARTWQANLTVPSWVDGQHVLVVTSCSYMYIVHLIIHASNLAQLQCRPAAPVPGRSAVHVSCIILEYWVAYILQGRGEVPRHWG